VDRFIARIEFGFEADALKDGGRRLRDLSAVAEPAGFRMIRGEVHPMTESQENPDRPGGPASARRSDPLRGHSGTLAKAIGLSSVSATQRRSAAPKAETSPTVKGCSGSTVALPGS
jgi:hypothetical protein